MKTKQIIFTKPNTAKLLEVELPALGDGDVLVKTLYTAVSAGTEYANLIGEKNINGSRELCNTVFPRTMGYSGVGIVEKTGKNVKSVAVGDRVIIYFGKHMKYNVINENNVYKIRYDSVPSQEASLFVIACFPMLAVRRTRLEIGESVIIAGLGILGLICVQLCKAAGAVPVMVSDPNPERRRLALETGADLAFDPTDDNFIQDVRQASNGKGTDVIIEVSGVNTAIGQLLDCSARFGRTALLGCSRKLDNNVDFYHQVHAAGVSIIGTNNCARPVYESRPGCWTYFDDCEALGKLVSAGRINLKPLINEIHSPSEAFEIYSRLAFDYKNFPIGVLFDWSLID